MRSKKRFLYALILMVVMLSATSARPTKGYLCFPPPGSCYSYCASGSQTCISASWNGYFCGAISGGCYGTIYCDMCM
jgi:hypothetical protein